MIERTRWAVGGLALAVGLLLVWAGCADPEAPREPPAPVDPSRVIVESQLHSLDEVVRRAGRLQAVRQQIAVRVEEEARRPFNDRVEDGLRYSTVFQREYIERQMAPIFVDEWGLTARGAAVMTQLADRWRHALEVETLHEEVIEHQLRSFAAPDDEGVVDEDFLPTVDELEALVELVDEAARGEDHEVGRQVLVEAVSSVDDDAQMIPELARFRQYHRREKQRFGQRAKILAELELRLADAVLRFARQMRHANLSRVDWRQMRDAGGSTEVILGRMQQTLRDFAAADAGSVEAVFRDLEPAHPQYRALLEATDRYRGYVDAGGWESVRPFDIELGAESAGVEALRQRLEAEDFDARPSSADEEFDPRVVDESLLEGIRAYQRTHQFDDDGQPTPGFWRSLNISAQRRVAQMELTLQRWRESHFEDDTDFIMVNIPGFAAEVYAGGERQMQIDVVVGRNQRRCDRDTERWVYPDATPVLMSEMDHIMFNPPWYVPDRLIEEVLKPEVEENPDYFDEEGYEEVELADGTTAVRQIPGEDNALGKVKFIFPNEHNVYLHDTPQQHYFDYTIRAYSHGCVRVSKPVELARHLVEWKGRNDLDVDEILAGDRTIRIDFERSLPVMVEYYTVWVDDDGAPHFLADIYQKDARRMADDPDEFDECVPARRPSSTATEEVPEDEEWDADDEPDDVGEDLGP